jgi:hypothetical protein
MASKTASPAAEAGIARPPLRMLASYSGHTHFIDWMEQCSKGGTVYTTVSVGQWDALLAEAYRTGMVLLELNDNENVIAAYQRGGVPCPLVSR